MRAAALVILHGWGSAIARWQPLVKKLESALPVILPALPQDKVRSTADFADWLYQKTKSRRAFYLLGHSFGGQIAINFASRYPRRVKKLILVNSAGVRRPSLKARLIKPFASALSFVPDSVKRLVYRVIGETDYFQASRVMKETMKLILKEDQRQAMKKITVSTLILWGKADRYTPLSDGELTHRLIKNSLWNVYDGGHGLPFTHVQPLAEKILWFIK